MTIDNKIIFALALGLGVLAGMLRGLPLTFTAVNLVMMGAVVLGILGFVGFKLWSDKLLRTHFEAIWTPLDESEIYDVFKRHIAKNTEPAVAVGYVPVGLHLVKELPLGQVQAACLIHPQGHSLIHLMYAPGVLGVEIQSFLDDGSVIESSNTDDAVTISGLLEFSI